jgi:hypothetical protein
MLRARFSCCKFRRFGGTSVLTRTNFSIEMWYIYSYISIFISTLLKNNKVNCREAGGSGCPELRVKPTGDDRRFLQPLYASSGDFRSLMQLFMENTEFYEITRCYCSFTVTARKLHDSQGNSDPFLAMIRLFTFQEAM